MPLQSKSCESQTPLCKGSGPGIASCAGTPVLLSEEDEYLCALADDERYADFFGVEKPIVEVIR